MDRRFSALVAALKLAGAFVHPAEAEGQRRQRTEAEARASADSARAERARLRAETGRPVELISDYAGAVVGPVPEALGLRAFLVEGGFHSFTDTFETLHGLKQLPGIALCKTNSACRRRRTTSGPGPSFSWVHSSDDRQAGLADRMYTP